MSRGLRTDLEQIEVSTNQGKKRRARRTLTLLEFQPRLNLAVGATALTGEAIGTVYRLVTARLERHSGLLTAVGTSRGEHLALAAAIAAATTAGAVATSAIAAAATLAAGGLAGTATIGTTGGLVLEPLGRVELLLPARENECLTAIAAA
jgi:hypothetical protein